MNRHSLLRWRASGPQLAALLCHNQCLMPVQTYIAPGRLEPRVKASQCFTKYRWRDPDAAKRQSGPQIVATQVVTQSRMLQ